MINNKEKNTINDEKLFYDLQEVLLNKTFTLRDYDEVIGKTLEKYDIKEVCFDFDPMDMHTGMGDYSYEFDNGKNLQVLFDTEPYSYIVNITKLEGTLVPSKEIEKNNVLNTMKSMSKPNTLLQNVKNILNGNQQISKTKNISKKKKDQYLER